MSKAVDRPSLFERLREGLQESIAFARGELALRTTEIPKEPPQLSATDVANLRRNLKMSQTVFAALLNVSLRTIEEWETGGKRPSESALRLLQLVKAKPKKLQGRPVTLDQQCSFVARQRAYGDLHFLGRVLAANLVRRF